VRRPSSDANIDLDNVPRVGIDGGVDLNALELHLIVGVY